MNPKLWLLVASSSLCLLGAEVWARRAETTRLRIPHPTRHHALKPLDESFQEVWGDRKAYMAVNSLGMRDVGPRQIALRDPQAFRLLFLGDSFTEGVGATFPDTAVHQVELALAATPSPARVACLNGGVASYSPVLEYIMLRELLREGLLVDGVVLLLDVSDPQDEVIYQAYLGDSYGTLLGPASDQSPGFHSRLFIAAYKRIALFRRIASRLESDTLKRRTSGLWRDGYYQDRNAWMDDEDLMRRWAARGLDLMCDNVVRIKGRLDREEIPLLLVLYPWPRQVEGGERPSLYRDRVLAIARNHGIPTVDLFPAFWGLKDWRSCFMPEEVHWTPRGHRVVASAIAEAVRQLGWLDARAARSGP